MKNKSLFLLAFLSIGARADEKLISVPIEPKVKYFLLDKAKKGDMSVVITRRVGPSGTSYASRLYNCADATFKYIGEGDTLEEMDASTPDAKMTPLHHGSSAYYVGIEACK